MENRSADLVWAQLKYCAYWPARIVDAPLFLRPIPHNKKCVLFFGTKNFGIVGEEKIKNYHDHRDELIEKGRGASFKNAVDQLEQYMSDRVRFRGHATVQPIDNKIRIKSERGSTHNFKVKSNTNTANKQNSGYSSQDAAMNTQKWKKEKEVLVRKIVDLKSENQRNVLHLKKFANKYDDLKSEKMKVEQRLTEKVLEVSNELKNVKEEYSQKASKDKITISKLTQTNHSLQARIKQLQTGISQKTLDMNKNFSDNLPDNIYEVEKLINHKKIGDGLHYLVRWKNFSAEYDTWERESNLMCRRILNDYKRKMKIN